MIPSRKVDEADLVDGIKRNDAETIRLIYHENFSKIKRMVAHFQYIKLDAEDVFQDGLTLAIINIRRGVFKGDSSFSTYLYGICRNICLKEYNRNKGLVTTEVKEVAQELEAENFDAIRLLIAAKDKLDPLCISIIDMRFGIGQNNAEVDQATRFEAIAQRLNITSDNARQRFGRCITKLKKLLDDSGFMNQLLD